MKKDSISLNRKKHICETLKQLMTQKNVQKITIQELADQCDISRYTFYYHFADIYDCLSWILHEELQTRLQTIEESSGLNDHFIPFLEHIRENPSLYKHLLNSPRPDLLRNVFRQEGTPLVRLYLSRMLEQKHYQATEEYLSFLIDFFISAFEGILILWIESNLDCSDELLTHYLHTILDDQFEHILSHAEEQGFCTKINTSQHSKNISSPDVWNHL